MFIAGLGSQISFNLDNVVVGAYLGTAAVAVYAVAARLSEYQRRVCDQFSGMLFPVVVGFDAQGDRDALRTTLVDGSRVAILLVVGVTTCLVGFGRPLIAHWMGSGFDAAVSSLMVLAFVGVLMVSHAAPSNVLLATGGHRLVAFVWIVEGAANLVLSVILVRRFGAVGVALGTAIPMAIGHVGVLTPAACRRVGLPIRRYLALTVLPALACAVPAMIACLAFRTSLPPSSTAMVVAEGAAVGLLYAAAVTVIGLDAPTRAAYVAHLRMACRSIVPRRFVPSVSHVVADEELRDLATRERIL
jgi:O-antigen/teichoic acid export membrane protein